MKKLLLLSIALLTLAGMLLTSCNALNKTTSTPEETSTPSISIDQDIFNTPEETTTPPAGTTTPAATVAPDQMVLVPLAHQTLSPSPTAQKVSWNDQVTMTVPGGLLTDSETLTISRVDNAPADGFAGATPLAAYDVSLGDLKEFDTPLTLEIAYDPAKLQGDVPPDQSIYAEWWDASQGVWWRTVSQVDAQRNTVVIATEHLSRWRIEMLARGDETLPSKHFIVVWNPQEKPKVAGVEQDPKAFAQKVSDYLESAWQKYYDEKYAVNIGSEAELEQWPTDWPNTIELGRVWVVIDQAYAESETGWLSGDITLKAKFDDDDQVKQDTAHELFHTTHLRKVGEYVYVQSHWWADAAADYAATRVAWPNLKGMSNVSGDYFQSGLTTCDSVHEYETARFIEYLVRHGTTFTQLFNDMTPHGVVATPDQLDTVVQKYWSKNLMEVYRSFVAAVLFDTGSPLEPIALNPSLLEGLTSPTGAPDSLAADVTSLSYSMLVTGDYGAQRWGFKVDASASTPTRTLTVTLTPGFLTILPKGKISATIYVLKNDKRVAGGISPLAFITTETTSVSINVSDGDVVYIIAVDGAKDNCSVDLDVKEAPKTPAAPTTATIPVSGDFGMQYTEGGLIHYTGTLTIQVQGKGAGVDVSNTLGGAFNVNINKNEPCHIVLSWQSTLSQTTEQKNYDDGSYQLVTYHMPFDPEPFYTMDGVDVGTMTKAEGSVTYDFTPPQVECSSELDWAPTMVFSEYDENGNLSYTEDAQTMSVSADSIINIYINLQ